MMGKRGGVLHVDMLYIPYNFILPARILCWYHYTGGSGHTPVVLHVTYVDERHTCGIRNCNFLALHLWKAFFYWRFCIVLFISSSLKHAWENVNRLLARNTKVPGSSKSRMKADETYRLRNEKPVFAGICNFCNVYTKV